MYDNWGDCEEQVKDFPGAKYKGFDNPEEAARAFREGSGEGSLSEMGDFLVAAAGHREKTAGGRPQYMDNPDIDQNAWAVDASCKGNPGIMEYRGVELKSGKVLFNVGPFRDATNNIGEFLAIVHALAEMYRRNEWHNIYSDSMTAQAWVRNRQVKTQLKPTENNQKLFELLGRGLAWIRTHHWPVKIMKWQTELWGEIPADYGRK